MAGTAAIQGTDCVVRDARVFVRWQAPNDLGLAGFYLERLDTGTGRYVRVNPDLVENTSLLNVATWYEACDPLVSSSQTNTYRIVEVRTDGTQVGGDSFSPPPRLAAQASVSVALEPSSASPGYPASAVQAVAGARVKVLTERTGLHVISAESLAANLEGYTPETVTQRIASGGFQLICGTNEVAWMPAAGNTGIVFYAVALDSIYTKWNVYWVTPVPGLMMNVRNAAAPTSTVSGLAYRDVVHFEEDRTANPVIFQDPQSDIWFWVRLIVNTNKTTATNLLVNVPWAQAGDGSLRVELKGSSTQPSIPPHHARISLNGQLLGTMDWTGYEVCDTTFSATNWLAGTNTVRVEGYSQAGESDGATFYVDWLDVSCSRQYMAFSNSVWCSSGSNTLLTVGGFTRQDIQVFDVTDPFRPITLEGGGLAIDSPGAGSWRVTFEPVSPDRQYCVMAGDLGVPVKVVGRPAARWSNMPHAADYVVVYHDSLKDGAASLV